MARRFSAHRKSATGLTRRSISEGRLPLILWLLCLPLSSAAQVNPRGAGFGIETNLAAGRVLKHTSKFRAPVPPVSTAVELNFIQHTYGRQRWHRSRHFPVPGFGVTYTNYGIDSIYGRCVSFYPNLQFLLVHGKRLEWTLRAGFGGGFVTRHYERAPSWDTLNNAIGSRLNNFTTFATDLRYRLSDHLDLQAGANFSHISNAAFRQPNLGVNMCGGHIGVRYYPVTSRVVKSEYDPPPLRRRWLAQARLGLTANESGSADGPLYPVYLASVYASRRWHSYNKLLIGFDYSYHSRIYAFLRNNEILPGEEKKNAWKGSAFIGNEFLFGRFGVVLQVGVYLKNAYLRLAPYYEKLGGNIYILQRERGIVKELFGSALLKTHLTQAEMAEFGIGVGF